MWDPLDTKSHESSGTSQDCPGMSLVGSSGHQVTPIFKDVPGLSWDVPCRTLWTKSHTNLQGRPRTVLGLGCPLQDLLDTKSHQSSGMSQDSPGVSLMGSSGHPSLTNLQRHPRTVLGCLISRVVQRYHGLLRLQDMQIVNCLLFGFREKQCTHPA